MRLAYFKTTQIFAEIFVKKQLTPIQFSVLEIIATNEHISQTELATLVGTTSSVLVAPIRKLEERKLLTRVRTEMDRRQYDLQLTKAGEALRNEAHLLIAEVEERLASGLDSEERDTLLRLLQKVVEPEG